LTFLTYGKTYTFDLYQCERMQYNSASRMVTNICLPSPKGNPVTSWSRDYGGVD
jgi:hypothetical protein